jgi:hypothetical protein
MSWKIFRCPYSCVSPATKADGAEVFSVYIVVVRGRSPPRRDIECKRRSRDDNPERVLWQHSHDDSTQNTAWS